MIQPPVLRIVRGEPTDAELAALITVLAARSGAAVPAPPRRRDGWTDRAGRLGAAPLPSPDGWWRSGLPVR